ncbi:MAG: flagellar protein [Bacillales bacterium]|jgi:flagellar operon protein (TIGR03826 family)|nr:flagellar protein [Bacillales bacterium]
MAAQLMNCRKCGKLFLRVKQICEDCYNKQEEDFKKVTDYLREFPGSTIHELVEETKVSATQIREFILAERILSSNFSNLSYSCESCGSKIQSGKLCSNCLQTINKLAKQVTQEVTPHREVEKSGKSSGYITRNL